MTAQHWHLISRNDSRNYRLSDLWLCWGSDCDRCDCHSLFSPEPLLNYHDVISIGWVYCLVSTKLCSWDWSFELGGWLPTFLLLISLRCRLARSWRPVQCRPWAALIDCSNWWPTGRVCSLTETFLGCSLCHRSSFSWGGVFAQACQQVRYCGHLLVQYDMQDPKLWFCAASSSVPESSPPRSWYLVLCHQLTNWSAVDRWRRAGTLWLDSGGAKSENFYYSRPGSESKWICLQTLKYDS